VDFEVVRATPADRARVVATVVAAFVADPAFRYFFPDDASYHRHAAAFTGYLFDRRVGLGTVWLAQGGAVAALWDPPAGAAPAIPEPSSEPVAPDVPAEVRERIDRYDETVHRLLPDYPFWYLGVVATHPAHAGRRLGRRLMAAGVTTAHADGLPAVLETTNPANVDLYQHEGWEVLAHDDGGGPPTWVLVNQPAVARGPDREERLR
jgi:GNAT superfamily N-acetyltransferase